MNPTGRSGGYDPDAGRNQHQANAPTLIPVPSLLRSLLSDHLDPGYAAAAAEREGGAPPPGRLATASWQVLAALAIATVFALAVGQAQATAPGVRESQQVLSGSVRSAEEATDAATARRDSLSAELDTERRSRLAGDQRGRQLLGGLDVANFSAAASAVTGPGLTVTVTDPGVSKDLSDVSKERVEGSRQVILDRDLQLVVNSLWASDAEAVSVGGVRIGPNVTIRQAGGGILVDNQPICQPVRNSGDRPAARDGRCVRPQPRPATAAALGGQLRRRGHRQLNRHRDRARRVGARCQLRQGDRRQMIGIAALVIGIVLGLVFHPSVPEFVEPYLPIAVVAALDAVFGGLRAYLERIFDSKVFVVSFVFNVLVAALIVYVGDQLGVGTQLSTAIIVVLGIRIFGNAAALRRRLFGA